MKAPVLEIASAAALERRLSRTLRDLAAIGEVCPALDHADITSHLGAQLLFEGLALLA